MGWVNIIIQGILVGGLYALFAAGLSGGRALFAQHHTDDRDGAGPAKRPPDDAAADGSTGGDPPQMAHLRSVVGLVWRSVVLWMLLVALLTLANLVG